MVKDERADAKRVDYLDGLRGFAALVVLIGHSWLVFSDPLSSVQLSDGIRALPGLLLKVLGLLSNSNSAVCIFFLLSGYVMADFAQRTLLSFPAQLVRRYIRLAVPILITSTGAYLLLRFGLFRNAESARIFGVWAAQWYQFEPAGQSMVYESLVGTFTTGSDAYNPNLWTMQPELLGSFYVLLIGVAAGSRRWRTVLYAGIIAYYLFDYLPLFAVGALIREYDASIRRIGQLPWAPIVLCAIGLYICTLPEIVPGNKLELVYPFPRFSYDNTRNWHSIGATLLLIGVLTSSTAQRSLASSLGKFLGRISFTLYLIHVPILCSLGAWLIVELAAYGNTTAAAVGLPVTIFTCLGLAALLSPLVDGGAVSLSRHVGRRLDEIMTGRKEVTGPSPKQERQVAGVIVDDVDAEQEPARVDVLSRRAQIAHEPTL
jgi:peptidoglycan/LPS O-acetylase OafA/YrhL